MTTAEKILQLRAEKDLTQAALAELLKVQPAAVSAWENGKNGLNKRSAWKLSKVFGLPFSYFIEEPRDSDNTGDKIQEDYSDA